MDGPTNGQNDQQTDRLTNIAIYRIAIAVWKYFTLECFSIVQQLKNSL